MGRTTAWGGQAGNITEAGPISASGSHAGVEPSSPWAPPSPPPQQAPARGVEAHPPLYPRAQRPGKTQPPRGPEALLLLSALLRSSRFRPSAHCPLRLIPHSGEPFHSTGSSPSSSSGTVKPSLCRQVDNSRKYGSRSMFCFLPGLAHFLILHVKQKSAGSMVYETTRPAPFFLSEIFHKLNALFPKGAAGKCR